MGPTLVSYSSTVLHPFCQHSLKWHHIKYLSLLDNVYENQFGRTNWNKAFWIVWPLRLKIWNCFPIFSKKIAQTSNLAACSAVDGTHPLILKSKPEQTDNSPLDLWDHTNYKCHSQVVLFFLLLKGRGEQIFSHSLLVLNVIFETGILQCIKYALSSLSKPHSTSQWTLDLKNLVKQPSAIEC